MPRRTNGKRLSGAAQRKQKREELRAAEKSSRWNATDLRAFAALARHEAGAAGAYAEALEALRLVVRRAARNPALTPQQRHEMVGRHAAGLVKAADPGRLIQQLAEELREAHAHNQALKAKLDAAIVAARNQGGAQVGSVN
jgi:hypothetical protein